ncbi:hypothetical protein RA997_23010, partial [Mycobacteroides abscessus subsp. abscessus]
RKSGKVVWTSSMGGILVIPFVGVYRHVPRNEDKMLSTLGKLFHISQWKPKARERGLVFAMISGPLALLLVVLMLLNTARILAHLPKPVDTYKAITEVTRVQNY